MEERERSITDLFQQAFICHPGRDVISGSSKQPIASALATSVSPTKHLRI
jgi:hypothetical protein